ncbi:MAG TPA: NAD-dependent epimerase/dehydratase family protein, partial [Woeseiaceae bacterium]|nr:NAD-dependent epimerase/dehydratase family protein [Woeseiaceae bacterium]
MRIALIGGTGFVGRYLVDAIHAHGRTLSLLVRPGSESKLKFPQDCRIVRGDLGSRDAIEGTVRDADAVIYNVGILREVPRRGITFEALQYDGLVRVVDIARDCGVPRLVLMSANGVSANGTAYQRTKYRAEQYAWNSGMAVTVFRPSVIFGDPRGAMEFATQLYRDMINPPLPAVGFYSGWNPARGQVLVSPVHVEDVASAFDAALDDPASIGRTFPLGGPEILSWFELITRIAAAAGRRKWIIPMPLPVMQLAAAMLDWSS